MNDLDALKPLLQQGFEIHGSRPIGKEELMASLQAKTTDIRKRTLRRVGKEIQMYIFVLVIPVVGLFLRHGISARAIVGSIAVSVLLGLTIAALAYEEYQLRSLPLHGSLRESLTTLIAAIDSMRSLYLAAYLITIVIPVVLAEAFLLWRLGLGFSSIAALVAGIALVAWCYVSGRGYLDRAFGGYRAELADCLRELQSA